MSTPYALGKHPGKDPDKSFKAFLPIIPAAQLPANWSYEYLEDDIDNQGQVGTCVAHGCAGIGELFNFKRHQTRIEMSRIAIYSQAKHSFEPNDIQNQGLNVSDGLKVLQQFGYVPETKVPYVADPTAIVAPIDPSLWQKDFLIREFVSVPNNVEMMHLALMQHGPIIIGTPWAQSWFTPQPDGTLPVPDTSVGGHCVLCIGYSDTRHAFRVRNSWGAEWGNNGHYWLPYTYVSGPFAPDDMYTVRA